MLCCLDYSSGKKKVGNRLSYICMYSWSFRFKSAKLTDFLSIPVCGCYNGCYSLAAFDYISLFSCINFYFLHNPFEFAKMCIWIFFKFSIIKYLFLSCRIFKIANILQHLREKLCGWLILPWCIPLQDSNSIFISLLFLGGESREKAF